MGSYFVSVTASHYDWAMKKLKAHKKNCANMQQEGENAFCESKRNTILK